MSWPCILKSGSSGTKKHDAKKNVVNLVLYFLMLLLIFFQSRCYLLYGTYKSI